MAALSRQTGSTTHGADDEAKRARLREIIKERSFVPRETKLASGRISPFYFDMKRTLSQPEALSLLGDLMLLEVRKEEAHYIGGLQMGAVPILDAIAMRSWEKGTPTPLIWIRKEAKEHGTKRLIEGEAPEKLRGKKVVMVDDVTTSGGSVMDAIGKAREHGALINVVISVVDREEGALENLEAAGIKLKSLFTASDFFS